VSEPSSISVTLTNQLTEIERLAHIVDAFCAARGISPAVAYRVNLACDEVIMNAIVHGYEDAREHEILVSLALDGESLLLTIVDDGRAFNPLEAPPVDFDTDPLERPVGGLGLHLVRTVMNSIDYRRENGRNVLEMRIGVR
jgi:anti-sigma regulatory factor (Ser/Thr protein kinase)